MSAPEYGIWHRLETVPWKATITAAVYGSGRAVVSMPDFHHADPGRETGNLEKLTCPGDSARQNFRFSPIHLLPENLAG